MSTVARISLDEYHRMIDSGVFDGPNRRRIELIYGELREMTLIGPPHAHIASVLVRWSLTHVAEEQTVVRCQSPIEIADLVSEPEPDIAWVAPGRYDRRHPCPDDVLLLIEVAESSLAYDLGEKAGLYAKAKVAEIWVVDVVNERVEVLREPSGGRYRSRQTFHAGDTIHTLAFPQLAFPVSVLFNWS